MNKSIAKGATLKGNDELINKLIMLVRGDGLSIAAAARSLGVGVRSAQEFFSGDKKWAEAWWERNEEDVDAYFAGFARDDLDDYEDKLMGDVVDVEVKHSTTYDKPKWYGKPLVTKHRGAKILFFDIETSPILGNVWSLWQQNVGLNQIAQDWYVLSWAAKWQHEDEVMYQDKSKSWDSEDDSELLEGIWKLLDEADIVVGQNSKRFDEKKLNARFIMNGMKPPSTYRSVDTLEIAKRHFGFTSNKLEYMSDKLCKRYKKLKHGAFAGFELWRECLRGNPLAWAEMEEYNIHDVLALEELYDIMKPWYRAHPNVNLYTTTNDTSCVCGANSWKHNGYHYTNLSKFDRFACNECGATQRGKVNLLSQEKRETILRNVL